MAKTKLFKEPPLEPVLVFDLCSFAEVQAVAWNKLFTQNAEVVYQKEVL